MTDLRRLVTDKIGQLGVVKAKEFFGVSAGTISNWSTGRTDPSIDAAQRILAENEIKLQLDQPGHEPTLEQWDGRNVIMLLPLYRGFSPDTHFTLFANYAKYGPEKIGMLMEKRTVIHESRNILVHKARQTGAEWFIFVDDDMIIPCGSAALFESRYGASGRPGFGVNGISRLMSHSPDKRIVGGLYFGRHARGRAQCSSGFSNSSENEKYRAGEYDGLRPEEWVGTGFLKMHRSVFDDLQKAVDGGLFPECKPSRDDLWYGFFNPIRVGVGEDVSFGRRCAEIGITSYVDAGLVCLHNGECFYGPNNTRSQ